GHPRAPGRAQPGAGRDHADRHPQHRPRGPHAAHPAHGRRRHRRRTDPELMSLRAAVALATGLALALPSLARAQAPGDPEAAVPPRGAPEATAAEPADEPQPVLDDAAGEGAEPTADPAADPDPAAGGAPSAGGTPAAPVDADLANDDLRSELTDAAAMVGKRIDEVQFRGNRKVEDDAIAANLLTRVGGQLDLDRVGED